VQGPVGCAGAGAPAAVHHRHGGAVRAPQSSRRLRPHAAGHPLRVAGQPRAAATCGGMCAEVPGQLQAAAACCGMCTAVPRQLQAPATWMRGAAGVPQLVPRSFLFQAMPTLTWLMQQSHPLPLLPAKGKTSPSHTPLDVLATTSKPHAGI
jgi:hypothetical protein